MASGPWIVSKADFARLMGVSKPMVSKWVAESRMGAGLRADGSIDVAAACRSLGRAVPERGQAPVAALALAAPVPAANMADDDGASLDPLLESRIAAARLRVRRDELDLAEREGRLVDAATVRSTVESLSRQLRERVMAVPGDIADRCVGMSAARIELLLSESLESALNQKPE